MWKSIFCPTKILFENPIQAWAFTKGKPTNIQRPGRILGNLEVGLDPIDLEAIGICKNLKRCITTDELL